jgi:hypothetical protein
MPFLEYFNFATFSNDSMHEEFCFLEYNVVWGVESKPIFRRNMWPPSSGSKKAKQETSMK